MFLSVNPGVTHEGCYAFTSSFAIDYVSVHGDGDDDEQCAARRIWTLRSEERHAHIASLCGLRRQVCLQHISYGVISSLDVVS